VAGLIRALAAPRWQDRDAAERALAALPPERVLPLLVPEMHQRRKGFEAARKVASARGKPTAHQEERFRRVASVLSLDTPVKSRRTA